MPASETTHTIAMAEHGPVAITVSESGAGRPFLLLHGGAGPLSVEAFGGRFANEHPARVLIPTHPGFQATPRPESLTEPRQLAQLYLALLDELELTDVTVVGNSIGGWIAAEMAALASPTRISSVVIVDAVGLDLPENPVVDFFSLSFAEIAQRSYHAPERFAIDPASLPPEAQQAMAGNRQVLAVYGGQAMADPSLSGRLAEIELPTLVVWGESDEIANAEYGRAFAEKIPGTRFELMRGVGHLPQIEHPAALSELVWAFADANRTGPASAS
jgi:pimeloyl-ACP methyl ester carboxylesterase